MVYKLAEDVHQRFGTVDVVINNAGVSTNGTEFLKTADEDSERVIDVNLKSLIWMAKSFLPQMLERRSGHFVCIGSMLSFMTIPELVEYVASKFGMFGVMETLEHSFWFRGIYDIKFTTCFPCWVSTPMVEGVTDFGGWPLITPSECARQIIDGIELERRFVFIPGREAWLFFFKGYANMLVAFTPLTIVLQVIALESLLETVAEWMEAIKLIAALSPDDKA